MSTKTQAANLVKSRNPLANFIGQSPVDVARVLSKWKTRIELLMPGKIFPPERLIQIISQIIPQNPDWAKCTVQSWVGAMLACATIGLDPTPELGWVYFVPYDNKIKDASGRELGKRYEIGVIIGYKGKAHMIREAVPTKWVFAKEVCENDDEFDYAYGGGKYQNYWYHKPAKEDRGRVIGAYGVIEYTSGVYDFAYLNLAEITKRKSCSRAANSKYSPWTNWFEKMAAKSALHEAARLSPMLPVSQAVTMPDEKVYTEEDFADIRLKKGKKTLESTIDQNRHDYLKYLKELERVYNLRGLQDEYNKIIRAEGLGMPFEKNDPDKIKRVVSRLEEGVRNNSEERRLF